jgi:transposase
MHEPREPGVQRSQPDFATPVNPGPVPFVLPPRVSPTLYAITPPYHCAQLRLFSHTHCTSMARRRQYSKWDSPLKNRLVGAIKFGNLSISAAAKEVGMPFETARDIMRKFKETGSTHRRPGPSRPKKVDFIVELDVCWRAVDNRWKPLWQVGRETKPHPLSASAVRAILEEYKLGRRRARKVIRKPQRTRERRLDWAYDHEHWTIEWQWVIWSDECYIILGEHPGIVWVTRAKDEEYDDECTVPFDKQSDKRIMVWGCVMKDSKGPLVVLEYPGGKGGGMDAARYQKQVRRSLLLLSSSS